MILVKGTRIHISLSDDFILKMLNWADRFSIFSFLNGHHYPADRSFPLCLAAGARRSLQLESGSAFHSLKHFFDERPSWLFGHLGYDLMAETLGVASRHQPERGFGQGFFFEPEVLIQISADGVTIFSDKNPHDILLEINACPSLSKTEGSRQAEAAIGREEYMDIISQIRGHIQRGDCYELNYCLPFYAGDVHADPVGLFQDLMRISPNPFSALYKLNGNYCLCASPERFLQKKGDRIVSQPMKGTARRRTDPVADEAVRRELLQSPKEKSENVMIVDLVRNDLSRISKRGTVAVEELFGIYSFPFVHQMVSTISSVRKSSVHWTDILSACFPMGSMTGAPKIRVTELIDQYEIASRGLYSGSIGFVDPQGDFDFNVVIRSLFFNQERHQAHFWVGSGITHYSRPENEYDECLLKAGALIRLLSGK